MPRTIHEPRRPTPHQLDDPSHDQEHHQESRVRHPPASPLAGPTTGRRRSVVSSEHLHTLAGPTPHTLCRPDRDSPWRTERAGSPAARASARPTGDGSGAQPPGDFIIGSSSRLAGCVVSSPRNRCQSPSVCPNRRRRALWWWRSGGIRSPCRTFRSEAGSRRGVHRRGERVGCTRTSHPLPPHPAAWPTVTARGDTGSEPLLDGLHHARLVCCHAEELGQRWRSGRSRRRS